MVDIRGHNFGAQSCEIPRLGPVYIPGKHARGEITVRVVKDGPNQTATLCPGGSQHCDHFFNRHDTLSFENFTTPSFASPVTFAFTHKPRGPIVSPLFSLSALFLGAARMLSSNA
jgi:hypothetical protein